MKRKRWGEAEKRPELRKRRKEIPFRRNGRGRYWERRGREGGRVHNLEEIIWKLYRAAVKFRQKSLILRRGRGKKGTPSLLPVGEEKKVSSGKKVTTKRKKKSSGGGKKRTGGIAREESSYQHRKTSKREKWVSFFNRKNEGGGSCRRGPILSP